MAKRKSSRSRSESVLLRDDEVPSPIVTRSEDPFADPRNGRDRRQKDDSTKIPTTGCRRFSDRRTTVYIKNDDWWMKRNYNNGK